MEPEMRGGYFRKTLPKEEVKTDGDKPTESDKQAEAPQDPISDFELDVLKRLVRTVDFKCMTECIDEIALKSGVKQENINHKAIRNFKLVVGGDRWFTAAGGYRAGVNDLSFGGGFLGGKQLLQAISKLIPSYVTHKTSEKEADKIVSNPRVRTMFLSRFIHEAIHSMTRVRVIETENTESGFVHSDQTVGYDIVAGAKVGGIWTNYSTAYEVFNEGVTERLSQMVLFEYLKRTGLTLGKRAGPTALMRREIRERHNPLGYQIGPIEVKLLHDKYATHCAMVQLICDQLAAKTGHRWEDVWHAFVRGAFGDGPQLFSKEMRKDLGEVFGQSFVYDLSQLTNESSILKRAKFFRKYLKRNITSEFSPRWAEYLGIDERSGKRS